HSSPRKPPISATGLFCASPTPTAAWSITSSACWTCWAARRGDGTGVTSGWTAYACGRSSLQREAAGMTITVVPRHPALGAEIRGVDMRRPPDGATRQEILDAWMKHLVVVFPDQPITDQEHVAFTRQFGEPEIFHQTSLHLRSDRVREIFLVSNVDE